MITENELESSTCQFCDKPIYRLAKGAWLHINAQKDTSGCTSLLKATPIKRIGLIPKKGSISTCKHCKDPIIRGPGSWYHPKLDSNGYPAFCKATVATPTTKEA